MVQHSHRVVSRDELLDKIWGFHTEIQTRALKEGSAIASYLGENKLNLDDISKFRLKLGIQKYYVNINQDEKQKNSYLAFYVDVTTISKYTDREFV